MVGYSVGTLNRVLVPIMVAAIALCAATVGVSAEQPKVLRFLTTETDPPSLEVYYQVIAEFQKAHPDTVVLLETATFADRVLILATQVASGVAPDVAQVNVDEIVGYARQGKLLALDDIVSRVGRQDFYPGALIDVDGHIYALPYAGDSDVLWVRKDLAKQHGVVLPRNWDEWLDYARRLTLDTNGDGRIDIYGTAVPASLTGKTDDVMQEILWASGWQTFDADYRVVYDHPRSVRALEFLGRLAAYSPPGIASYSFYETLDGFASTRIASALYPGRMLSHLAANNPRLLESTGAMPLPAGPVLQTSYVNWNSYVVFSSTKHPEEAKAFLEFLVTGDRAIRFVNTVPGHNLPPLRSLAHDDRLRSHPLLQQHPDIASVLFAAVEAAIPLGAAGIFDSAGNRRETFLITNPYATATRQEVILPQVLQMHILRNVPASEAVRWGHRELLRVKERVDRLAPKW
ncbi:ABC transporter substrate-binding protein [Geochorda subterranea]|uniref:Sugar ABC transporter substrate-binding protein n=1 Tax=Geochorda subterranea TaxID=3109564 RepID=A0ABZ1BQ41_9FIRM|nr:sugar ABC transporter substrate-binding protein [Limnochorda sp. LNt]WRP14521.1 sugar ABC transporter substrate-binding protein [Limnochorda sp. LNt]